MSPESANRRLALRLLAIHLAVTAVVYATAKNAPGQHWTAGILGSLVAADGICHLGLAVYLRVVHKRPHRSELLFLAMALATTGAGWYAVQGGLSFALVAGVTAAVAALQWWLRRYVFDPWWLKGTVADPNLVTFPADDAGLEAAKAEAKATLHEFLRRLSSPGADASSAAIKAPLSVPGGTEHVWLSSIRCEGNEFVGTVDNHPSPETGVRIGATMRVRHSEISDWKLVEHGQLIGGFTIRYFMSLMHPAQRAAVHAGLPFAIGPEAIPPAA